MKKSSLFSTERPLRWAAAAAAAATLLAALGAVTALSGCGAVADLRSRVEPDLIPPRLLSVRVTPDREVELTFDEPCAGGGEEPRIEPPLAVERAEARECVFAVLCPDQEPGLRYQLEAVVEDLCGNAVEVLVAFYGFNPRVPPLLINELTTRGTGNHPDVVELKALDGGDMGGITLYQGTPGNWTDCLVFPPLEVAGGDFLLVHFRPRGIPEEVDETSDPAVSGGLDACDLAYDFWVPGGSGISGNNGVISLYSRPGGPILDGILYSDRTSQSDERYRGFGTLDALERAEELAAEGGWMLAEDPVRPEDSVSPEGSTGTRSICRDSASTDSDTAADWHIVPTLGFTFGEENSDAVYLP